jgi:uncharacterized protein
MSAPTEARSRSWSVYRSRTSDASAALSCGAAKSANARSFMPEQHREFFEMLPLVFAGSLDETGQPWASMLVGDPGFVHSPDPQTLAIDALPHPADPLARALRAGAPIGLLGIQLETRRRNRLNGHVRAVGPDGFSVRVDQSFGNCPKYISAREPSPLRLGAAGPVRAETERLSDAAAACIAGSDTCFLASASAREIAADDSREGVDVSHRGGKPGFVRVDRSAANTTLLLPDFAGNNAFNTLGNLARYPRAGLLFPDFERGDVLLLACDAEIRWDGDDLARFAGAERLVSFAVRSGWYFSRFMPFRWTTPQPGPQVDRTGAW